MDSLNTSHAFRVISSSRFLFILLQTLRSHPAFVLDPANMRNHDFLYLVNAHWRFNDQMDLRYRFPAAMGAQRGFGGCVDECAVHEAPVEFQSWDVIAVTVA